MFRIWPFDTATEKLAFCGIWMDSIDSILRMTTFVKYNGTVVAALTILKPVIDSFCYVAQSWSSINSITVLTDVYFYIVTTYAQQPCPGSLPGP